MKCWHQTQVVRLIQELLYLLSHLTSQKVLQSYRAWRVGGGQGIIAGLDGGRKAAAEAQETDRRVSGDPGEGYPGSPAASSGKEVWQLCECRGGVSGMWTKCVQWI